MNAVELRERGFLVEESARAEICEQTRGTSRVAGVLRLRENSERWVLRGGPGPDKGGHRPC